MRLFVCLLAAFGFTQPSHDAAAELARLQGAWQPVRLERKGEFIDDCFRPSARIVIENDLLRFRVDDKTLLEFRCRVDPGRSPKAIDMTIASGPRTGAVLRGIYSLMDNRLTLCWPLDDQMPRPTLLLDAPHKDYATLVLQRCR